MSPARWSSIRQIWLPPESTFRSTHPPSVRANRNATGTSKSPDFLDVGRYPRITFRSSKIVPLGDHGSYNVTGSLTIRAQTREVTLRVDSLTQEILDPSGMLRRGATASTRIERKDFGLTWNAVLESGGFVVGDEIQIMIDVELARKPDSN